MCLRCDYFAGALAFLRSSTQGFPVCSAWLCPCSVETFAPNSAEGEMARWKLKVHTPIAQAQTSSRAFRVVWGRVRERYANTQPICTQHLCIPQLQCMHSSISTIWVCRDPAIVVISMCGTLWQAYTSHMRARKRPFRLQL